MFDITSKVWNAINDGAVHIVYEMETKNSITEGKCEYLMVDTDEYAKAMPRLSVRDNVMILCTSDQSFFTIMVPVFERSLSQREIDNIIMRTQDINKKVNLPSPIPYYIGEERHNEVTLFTNYKIELYEKVCKEIEERFKGIAEVRCLGTPDSIKVEQLNKRKSQRGETNLQKITKYLESKEIGEVFKMKELCEATKLTHKQVQKVKDNNPSIKNIFNKMKTDKTGWYVKVS